jgi:endonuclease G
MNNDSRLNRLHAMLMQVSDNSLESIYKPSSHEVMQVSDNDSRELISKPSVSHEYIESGLDKMDSKRLDQITLNEQYCLEAIVLPELRPVSFITGNSTYDDLPSPWEGLNHPNVKSRLGSLFQCIGRVELPNSPQEGIYAGTAFIVGNGRLMTNRHVAQLFAQGLGTGIAYRPNGSAIDFKCQKDSSKSDSHPLVVKNVEMIHPYWDMAILNVDGLPSGQMLNLSVKTPEELVGSDVIVVGYPARDWRNNLEVQDKVFEGIYNVKRLQPGKIRPRAKIQSFETLVDAMTHDASTLGGNSGSAVINVATSEVVSLHFGGIYLKENYGVPMYELARDSRVANLLNFDGSGVTPTTDFDIAWQHAQSREMSTPQPIPDHNQQSSGLIAQAITSSTTATSTFQIPITVSITVGNPVSAEAPSKETETVAMPAEAAESATFLESVGAVQVDFELMRAINVYIPILRACYAYFSTGNPEQPMPSGYERVSTIRARHEESAEALEPLSPAALLSLQNDFRALGQAEPGLESPCDPDAFGYVVRENETGSIIVGIRGTMTPEEWVKNFTAIPQPFSAVPGFGFVHLGFEKMWMRIRDDVMDALRDLPDVRRITFLGHSLGGAMATLGTVDIKKNLNRPTVDLATIGCPRIGQIRFRNNFDNLNIKALRVAEIRDIVPHVPPMFLVWSHVGIHIPVSSNADNPHSLDSYLEGLQRLNTGVESAGGSRVFATHMG